MTGRPQLVAELLAAEIRALQGAVGVLVQDVSYLTPAVVLAELGRLIEDGVDLRICYLLRPEKVRAKQGPDLRLRISAVLAIRPERRHDGSNLPLRKRLEPSCCER